MVRTGETKKAIRYLQKAGVSRTEAMKRVASIAAKFGMM